MESSCRLVGAAVAVAVLCFATAFPAVAAPEGPRTLTAAVRGELIDAPGAEARAEVVTFGADLAPSLLRVAPGESIRIAGWPVGPEVRADVNVTRFEVYAPDAKIWKAGPGGLTEVPRSRHAFFRGASEQDPDTRVFIALDPGTGTFQGLATSPEATFDLRSHGKDRYLVSVPEYFLPEDGTGAAEPLSSSCGQEDEVPDFLQESFRGMVGESAVVRSETGEAMLAALHTATIAVDTDNELMLLKFADDTTAATNYIASLIAAMNVIYERDLNIRLLQGTTFLRVSSIADPWNQTGSGASSAQLSEVASYWNTNHGAISRALVMALSGKSSSNFSSSGIAYVPGLCSTVTGYSFTQVFKFAVNTASNDAFVVGHELGHNFGSPHTHCYSPPIDTCYVQAGAGCYSGPTSCPASSTINGVSGVRGTIMSYCHLLGGCGASNVFHPTSVDRITGIITPRIGSCVFASATAPTISLVTPSQGPAAGGTTVTITGTNFQNGATVTFDGTSASSVTFNSATQLTAVTPAGTAGPADVVVGVAGFGNAFAAGAFNYLPPPTINSISPGSGPTSGGTTVTITGTNFQNGTTVTFGGTTAASVTFNSGTQLTAVTPAHSAGTVNVNIAVPVYGSAVATNGFTFIPPPTITTVGPGNGFIAGGTSVTITGTGFQNGANVTFGGTSAAFVTFNSATQLTAVTPARSAGTVNVVVTNPDTQSATATNAFTFLVPPPAVNAVTPTSGPTTGGTLVALNGTGFQSGATVTFDGIPATSVTFVNSTQITAVTPAHATGSVEVEVTNPDTQSGARNPAFFYSPPPAPTALYTVTPCRLIDTRLPSGPLAGPMFFSLQERTFDVTGACGIPSDAVALVVNLTVFDPAALGNLSVYPGNAFYLGTSVLNFQAGSVRANNAIIRLATDGSGTIGIRNGSAGASHVILDVMGYLLDDPDQ